MLQYVYTAADSSLTPSSAAGRPGDGAHRLVIGRRTLPAVPPSATPRTETIAGRIAGRTVGSTGGRGRTRVRAAARPRPTVGVLCAAAPRPGRPGRVHPATQGMPTATAAQAAPPCRPGAGRRRHRREGPHRSVPSGLLSTAGGLWQTSSLERRRCAESKSARENAQCAAAATAPAGSARPRRRGPLTGFAALTQPVPPDAAFVYSLCSIFLKSL